MTIKSWAGSGVVAVLVAAITLSTGQNAWAQDAQRPSATSPEAGARSSSLVNQLQMLKHQNRQLLGQVQTLRHQLEQLKEINKQQYILLDTRIKKLEQGGTASVKTPEPAAEAGKAPTDGKAGGKSASGKTPKKNTASSATDKTSVASAESGSELTRDAKAQKAYDVAFDALRAGDFATATRWFRQFTQSYPHDVLTPNAWYWLGESYYVTQEYEKALDAFTKVIELFPDSGKAPGALLKKGYSEYALHDTDKALATLKAVVERYPDHSVAQLAKQRMEDIRFQQQLN